MSEKGAQAAVCGLFCGTCPSYPQECGGCLSDRCCCDCFNGFKDCALAHQVTRCYECAEYPCATLESFSKKHIVNGICHHAQVIEDLSAMKLEGVDAWVVRKTQENTCPHCGNIILWYEKNTHQCKTFRTGNRAKTNP